jgi:hypothetical protein
MSDPVLSAWRELGLLKNSIAGKALLEPAHDFLISFSFPMGCIKLRTFL